MSTSRPAKSPMILAVASQKGGVGKTSVTVNLAYSLVKRGWRVLLVDTDTQGSIGLSLSKRAKQCRGLYDSLRTKEPLSKLVLSTRLPGLKILTTGRCDFDLEESLDEIETKRQLGALISSLSNFDCDLVIVDTPAGVGPVTRTVIANSDKVLVVEQAEPLSLRSLPLMMDTLMNLRKRGGSFGLIGVVLNMVNHSREESLGAAKDLRSLAPKRSVLQTVIPRDDCFLEASHKGIPLGMLVKNPPLAALVFDQLAAEIEPALNLSNQTDEQRQHSQLLD